MNEALMRVWLRGWALGGCLGIAACGGEAPPSALPVPDQAAMVREADSSQPLSAQDQAGAPASLPVAASEREPAVRPVPETEREAQAPDGRPIGNDEAETEGGGVEEQGEEQGEEDGELLEALLTQADAVLASGTDAAVRRLLRQALQARARAPQEARVQTLAGRAAAALMAWDRLSLAHGGLTLVQEDLRLLQRWDATDAGVQALREQVELAQHLAKEVARADRLLAASQRPEAETDKAVAVLRAVLARAPEHRPAEQRLAMIETRLLEAALVAADKGAFDEADALLARAGRVRDFSAAVQDVAARLVELRERRVSRLRERIQGALDAGDAEAAQAWLPELEAVAMEAAMVGEIRAQIERVQRYGRYDAGRLLVDPLASGGQGPGMVVLPVGRFAMGSGREDARQRASELPQHTVQFKRGFAMSRTEITVGQFRSFVDASGYRTHTRGNRSAPVYDERSGSIVERRGVTWRNDYAGKTASDDLPVVHVSWEDAVAYAQWLSEQTGARYRLPSEAEFEYALRAGSSGMFPWPGQVPPKGAENLTGARDASPSGRNWRNAFEGYGDGHWGPAPVGRFAANALGLADINGNVSEWVADCWHDSYARAPRDGSAWVNPGCEKRVIRGGSWASSPDQSRSAFRAASAPDRTSPRLGFRVVRELP